MGWGPQSCRLCKRGEEETLWEAELRDVCLCS